MFHQGTTFIKATFKMVDILVIMLQFKQQELLVDLQVGLLVQKLEQQSEQVLVDALVVLELSLAEL